jgi:hypothetical protein
MRSRIVVMAPSGYWRKPGTAPCVPAAPHATALAPSFPYCRATMDPDGKSLALLAGKAEPVGPTPELAAAPGSAPGATTQATPGLPADVSRATRR